MSEVRATFELRQWPPGSQVASNSKTHLAEAELAARSPARLRPSYIPIGPRAAVDPPRAISANESRFNRVLKEDDKWVDTTSSAMSTDVRRL